MIIHCGDVASYGKRWEVENFLHWFDKLDYKYKIFIVGNHDFFFEQEPVLAKSVVPEGIIYLEQSSILIEGLHFYGSPYTPTFLNWAFMKDPGKSMKNYCSKIPDDVDVLITHGPPLGILDRNVDGENCGSEELKNKLSALKPMAHLFGHIHEGFGRFKDEKGTEYINASMLETSFFGM